MHGALFQNAMLYEPNHQVFASCDLEETRTRVAKIFKPHHLAPTGRMDLAARMHHCSFGAVSLNRLCYGGDVLIEPGRLDDFYLIQMPLAGCAQIRAGDQKLVSDRHVASVLSASEPIRMRWSGDCDQLMIRIERNAVERYFCACCGQSDAAAPTFKVDLRWQENLAWCELMAYLVRLSETTTASKHALALASIEQLVLGILLTTQAHVEPSTAARTHEHIAPRHVKMVENYIEAHAEEPLTPARLAAVAGTSLRTLYAGFHDSRNTSPMAYLRRIRLQKVRQALLDSDASARITNVALEWGFLHLGRFSAEYRKAYGESPKETLRRG